MTPLEQDRALLDRFREGELQALSTIYRAYAPALARALRGGLFVSSHEGRTRLAPMTSAFEIDDVIQETFARAFKPSARLQYDGLRSFSTFLAVIARNLVIDRYRKDAPLQSTTDDAMSAHIDDSRTPESNAMANELKGVVVAFEAGLDSNDRALLSMRFLDNTPRRAVSERTGLSAMQVRQREESLRRRLFQALVAGGFGAPAPRATEHEVHP